MGTSSSITFLLLLAVFTITTAAHSNAFNPSLTSDDHSQNQHHQKPVAPPFDALDHHESLDKTGVEPIPFESAGNRTLLINIDPPAEDEPPEEEPPEEEPPPPPPPKKKPPLRQTHKPSKKKPKPNRPPRRRPACWPHCKNPLKRKRPPPPKLALWEAKPPTLIIAGKQEAKLP